MLVPVLLESLACRPNHIYWENCQVYKVGPSEICEQHGLGITWHRLAKLKKKNHPANTNDREPCQMVLSKQELLIYTEGLVPHPWPREKRVCSPNLWCWPWRASRSVLQRKETPPMPLLEFCCLPARSAFAKGPTWAGKAQVTEQHLHRFWWISSLSQASWRPQLWQGGRWSFLSWLVVARIGLSSYSVGCNPGWNRLWESLGVRGNLLSIDLMSLKVTGLSSFSEA